MVVNSDDLFYFYVEIFLVRINICYRCCLKRLSFSFVDLHEMENYF